MNNVLIIPGTYKSTITSSMAGDIIAQQYKNLRPFDIINQVYIADGGEGTLEVFSRNFGGINRIYMVHGMRGELVAVNTLWLDERTVIIESSSVVGFSLIPDSEKNPWELSSFGIGELLLLVKNDNAKVIYITMGDSLIMDIGIGMLSAIGVEFFDEKNHPIKISDLSVIEKIKTINIEKMENFSGVKIYALVDTKDYLIGEYGQINVYGAQKGLRQEQAEIVEKGYRNYVKNVYDMFAIDLETLPMASGSGGLAASLYAFLHAELIHCPLYIAERINLTSSIENADFIITGEGFLDNQTKWGKIPYFIAQRSKGHIFLIVGNYSNEGIEDIKRSSKAIIHIYRLNNNISIIEAMAEATTWVCNELDKLIK